MAPSKPLNLNNNKYANDDEQWDRPTLGFETILVPCKQLHRHTSTSLPLSSPPRSRSMNAANSLALGLVGPPLPPSSEQDHVHQAPSAGTSASAPGELEGALLHYSTATVLPRSSSSRWMTLSQGLSWVGSTSSRSNVNINMYDHQVSASASASAAAAAGKLHELQVEGTSAEAAVPAPLELDDYRRPNGVGSSGELDNQLVVPSHFDDDVANDVDTHMNSTTAASHFFSSKKWNVIVWMIAAVLFALACGIALGFPLGVVMGTKTYRQQQIEISSKRNRCASKGNKSKSKGRGETKSKSKAKESKSKASSSKGESGIEGPSKAEEVQVQGSFNKSMKGKGSSNKSSSNKSSSHKSTKGSTKSPTVCPPPSSPSPKAKAPSKQKSKSSSPSKPPQSTPPGDSPTAAPTTPSPMVQPTPSPMVQPTPAPTAAPMAKPPVVTPSPTPSAASPGQPQCPAPASPACLCGTCSYGTLALEITKLDGAEGTCVNGGGKKAQALCLQPPGGSSCSGVDLLSFTVNPGNQGGSTCDQPEPVSFNSNLKCPNGWYVERPDGCAPNSGVNNWEVQATCVNGGGRVNIHTSCSCDIGLCTIFSGYTIFGYQLFDKDNQGDYSTWYYANGGCTPTPAPSSCPTLEPTVSPNNLSPNTQCLNC